MGGPKRNRGGHAAPIVFQIMCVRSTDEDVLELPGILGVDVFREEARTAIERGPVGVVTFDRAEIGQLHFEAALVVDLVGLDDAGLGFSSA